MKKFLFILLFAGIVSAQEKQYDRLAFEVGFGGHFIADQSGVLEDNFFHMNFTGRYNLNETFGLGGVYAFDDLDFDDGGGTSYARLTLEAFVDLFDVFGMPQDRFTMLGHGGIGMATHSGDYFGVKTAGLTGIYNLNEDFSIKADFTTAGNFGQPTTLNDFKATNNAGLNSVLYNFSIGLVITPSRKGVHADFYEEKVVTETIYQKETVVKEVEPYVLRRDNILGVLQPSDFECNCEYQDYVFFDHDSFVVNDTELNTIVRVYAYLQDHPEKTLQLNGFASATQSSEDYNLALSEKRINTVLEKLVEMGLDESRVSTNPQGKDYNWAVNSLHDVSRRVELLIQ